MRELSVGETACISQIISSESILRYSELTGDNNPIHLQAEKAKEAGFSNVIAHGLLVGGMISKVIGTMLPGEGTIYLEQNFKFLKPVYAGDRCTAVITVNKVLNLQKGIYKLNTVVNNQNNEMVIDGYAVVKYL